MQEERSKNITLSRIMPENHLMGSPSAIVEIGGMDSQRLIAHLLTMPGTCQAAEHDPNNPNYLIYLKSLVIRGSWFSIGQWQHWNWQHLHIGDIP